MKEGSGTFLLGSWVSLEGVKGIIGAGMGKPYRASAGPTENARGGTTLGILPNLKSRCQHQDRVLGKGETQSPVWRRGWKPELTNESLPRLGP